jgi:hypothetical protein
LAAARAQFTGARTTMLLDFVAATKRGVCRHVGAKFPEDAAA